MSVTSGFFNSRNGDRRYNAEQIASIFNCLINDGVFANIGSAFAVNADSGNTILVAPGRAWFNSAWLYNDAQLPVVLDASEMVQHRIDAVVIEIDRSDAIREGSIKVVKGTPVSSNPSRPTLANSEHVHQYPLAYIYRAAGSNEIRQADITNMIGTASTPLITGILKTVSLDELLGQWQDELDRFVTGEKTKVDQFVETKTNEINQFVTTETTNFNEWFDGIKNVLDESTAANLLALIQTKIDKSDIVISPTQPEAKEGRIWIKYNASSG